jgi:hypothetical protein
MNNVGRSRESLFCTLRADIAFWLPQKKTCPRWLVALLAGMVKEHGKLAPFRFACDLVCGLPTGLPSIMCICYAPTLPSRDGAAGSDNVSGHGHARVKKCCFQGKNQMGSARNRLPIFCFPSDQRLAVGFEAALPYDFCKVRAAVSVNPGSIACFLSKNCS